MAALLTDRKINSLKPGQWATETHGRGAGQLQARGLKNKRVAYHFRYTDSLHKQTRISLGSGLSLLEARSKAQTLSQQLQEGHIPALPALTSRRASRIVANHGTNQQTPTFGALLHAYVEDLYRRNCTSASEVNNAFKRHIQQPWAKLWNLPVNIITTDHILQIVRCVADQNKLRAADTSMKKSKRWKPCIGCLQVQGQSQWI